MQHTLNHNLPRMFLDPVCWFLSGWWSVLTKPWYLSPRGFHFRHSTLVRGPGGSEATPLIGNAIKKNILHHHRPRHIADHPMGGDGDDGVHRVGDFCRWHCWVCSVGNFAALPAGMNVNTVHRWAHSTPRDLHWMIRALQKARVIQTPQHHALHHGLPRVTHYCAFTNWMNPVLERLRFWRGAEWCIATLTGIYPREDDSLPGSGPTPEWPNRSALKARHACCHRPSTYPKRGR